MNQPKRGGNSDQQPRRQPVPVRTGQGADSAFGKMIEDRPLVHRPHHKDEPAEPQQQTRPLKR